MEIKEAIKQLESLKEDRKNFLENDPEHDEIFLEDIEAIDTVLQALEKLQEENKKLKTKNRTQKQLTERVREVTTEQVVSTIEEFEKDYISKDKIKEKIEELKHKLTSKDFTHDMYIGTDKHIFWEHLCAKKDVLEELLKGE